jgi:hypothetical protein
MISNGSWQLKMNPGALRVTTNTDQSFVATLSSFCPCFIFFESSLRADGSREPHIRRRNPRFRCIVRLSLRAAPADNSSLSLWVLKHFASPQHRRVLRKFASRLGFAFSFVSYVSPSWQPRERIGATKSCFSMFCFRIGSRGSFTSTATMSSARITQS